MGTARRDRSKGGGSKPKFTKAQIAHALREASGMKKTAAEMLGCDRGTIYRAIDRWPELEEVVDSSRGHFVDEAENALRDQVLAGNVTAIIFTLKCLGRDRGYVEKMDVVVEEVRKRVASEIGPRLTRAMEAAGLTAEQATAIADALEGNEDATVH